MLFSRKSCIFAPVKRKTTQVYSYTMREIQAAEAANQQTTGASGRATEAERQWHMEGKPR